MSTSTLRAALFATVVLLACAPTRAEDGYPRGLLPDGVTPTRYSLELAIDPRQAGFTGTADIAVTIAEPTRSIWMHGLDLTQVEARVEAGGRTVVATYVPVDTTTGVVRLDLGEEVAGPATLHFAYHGTYREGSEGLFLIEAGGRRYVFSQLQAIDARRVFPSFDQPGFKTPFDLTIITTEGDVAITNTPLASTEELGDGRTRQRFDSTLPLPTYLLAFAVGPLDVVEAPAVPANEIRSWPLPLRGVATRGNGPRLAYALANTADMVERLERYFGMAFPYPKLDLIATPSLGGAMENAGAIVYDEYVLLLDADAPTTQLREFGRVHAHELAHQWFGDLVTPWWWEDTWLNESFATWLGEKIAAQWQPSLFNDADMVAGAFRVMDGDSRVASRPVREPIDDNLRISSTFDGLTYSKGGGLLRMFESFLGQELFREGVRLHVRRHLHGVATSDEFFAALADASRQPAIVDAFRGFVGQPGVPIVTASLAANGRQLLLSQKRYGSIGVDYPGAASWTIPVCVTVFGPDAPEKVCSLLSGTSGRMDLPAGTVSVMPNSGGAGYYRFAMAADQLDGLIAMAGGLPATEALALVDSVGAAFRAGQLPFDSVVSVARRLATHPERKVALALSGQLADIQSRWLDAREREAMAALIVDIYSPRLAELGLDPALAAYAGEEVGQRLLRLSLAELLAFAGDHEPTQAVLADAAKRSLEDPAALDPEYRRIAWAVGVRSFGKPFADQLVARLTTSPDPLVRNAAAGAVGASTDTTVSAMALNLLTEPGIRALDMFYIVFPQLGQPETREQAWAWLLANFQQFHDRLPGFIQDVAYSTPSSFCDSPLRDSAARFLQDALAAQRTNPRTVARTLESIDLCIAQKAALGGQVSKLLGGGA